MGARFPGLTAPRRQGADAPRRRPGAGWPGTGRPGTGWPGTGRHTSLIGDADDSTDPADYAARNEPFPQGTRVYIRGEAGYADTVVMGDLGLFDSSRTGNWPKIGVNRETPPQPWFQNRARLVIAAAGLASVGFAGFVGVPALLHALGVGTGPQGGSCPVCQFPIPSSAAVPPGPAAPPATAPPATSPAGTRAPATTPPPPVAVVPQPRSTPAGQTISPLGVTYSVIPGGNGQFTGQVTVVNRGSAPVTNWQMVVALPYDTVSAAQNAEISDSSDVLFLSPAPDDLSIAPGGTVVVSIFASGPTTTPAECSFNNVACQQ